MASSPREHVDLQVGFALASGSERTFDPSKPSSILRAGCLYADGAEAPYPRIVEMDATELACDFDELLDEALNELTQAT